MAQNSDRSAFILSVRNQREKSIMDEDTPSTQLNLES